MKNVRQNEIKRPRRYKLYDRLHLSVSTVNWVIYTLIGFIVVMVLVGILIR